MTAVELQRRLGVHAADFDATSAAETCAEIVQEIYRQGAGYPESVGKEHLGALRRKRWFGLMAKVADALIRVGVDGPRIRRQYAQALLDLGDVSAAVPVLREIAAVPSSGTAERAEAHGLLGRAHKQMYMDAGARRGPGIEAHLATAIGEYLHVYESDRDRYLWHGINAASLLWRARRDGIPVSAAFPATAGLARRVLDVAVARVDGASEVWDLAIAAEACVVLGEYVEAGGWLLRYVNQQEPSGDLAADAFEVASTHRQLTEVLQVDRLGPEGRFLADVLERELLRREGGALRASAESLRHRADDLEQAGEGYEKVFGASEYRPHDWIRQMLQCAQCVARVRLSSASIGTGFLLPAETLHAGWSAHGQVLVTNYHVFNSQKKNRGMYRASFDLLDAGSRFGEVLFESPETHLDVTVLALTTPVDTKGSALWPSEEVPEVAPDQAVPRLYVIGHPRGGDLSYSIQDNHLIAVGDPYVQYRSPTDPGSSGSPVFDASWNLVAVHHRGLDHMLKLDDSGETHPANQGVLISAIKHAIANPQEG